jgi:CRP-like cAMP-binding protein
MEAFDSLHHLRIFAGLSEDQLRQIIFLARKQRIPKGREIIREGEIGSEMYVLLEGRLGVFKKGAEGEVPLATLSEGEITGEVALMDRSPRSASVRTLEDSVLLVFNFQTLANRLEGEIYDKMIANLLGTVTNRLRLANDVTTKALETELRFAKERLEISKFLFGMLILLAGWIFAQLFLHKIYYSFHPVFSTFISSCLIVAVVCVGIVYVKCSSYPLCFFGLTSRNWRSSLYEGALFSIPFIGAVLLVRWAAGEVVPALQGRPLLNLSLYDPGVGLSLTTQLALRCLYIALTPLQEFAARGILQTMITNFSVGPRRNLYGIVLANLVFSSFHAFISMQFAISAFVAGLFWGWMFARHKSLIGPSVSHALCGGFILFFLNLF